jgi:hypothetical protein
MRLGRAWLAIAVLLLLGGNVAYAMPPQTVSLSMTGAVVSPGVQGYSLHGGQLSAAWILGTPLNLKNWVLRYDLKVVVSGLTATGTASFDLVKQTPHDSHGDGGNDQGRGGNDKGRGGGDVEVQGTVKINAMTPAVLFPLGCTPGLDCVSAIPALFNGTGTVTFSSGGSATTMNLKMGFESAYLNPFGGPILFASNAGEIIVIASYSQASVQWTGVQMGGVVTGTLGKASVSGSFGMSVSSSEDLRTGTEQDQGSIAFFGMSNPALNAAGTFKGGSIIPMRSSVPCPGFPPGTCNLTGLKSLGFFTTTSASNGVFSGVYVTLWTTPAVAFSSSVTGSLK